MMRALSSRYGGIMSSRQSRLRRPLISSVTV
jgi:hypothetical protein